MSTPVEFRVDPLSDDEIRAVKALKTGDAAPHQQQLALRAIVNKLCRSHDLLYVPGNADAGVFLNGRAFVGAQLLKILSLPVAHLSIEIKQ